jgi:hypothetical protein
VLVVMLSALALSSLGGLDGAAEVSRKRSAGRDALLEWAANPRNVPDSKRLGLLYPRPDVVIARAPILVEYRLALFKENMDSVSSH